VEPKEKDKDSQSDKASPQKPAEPARPKGKPPISGETIKEMPQAHVDRSSGEPSASLHTRGGRISGQTVKARPIKDSGDLVAFGSFGRKRRRR
jgi:hypothetical protein